MIYSAKCKGCKLSAGCGRQACCSLHFCRTVTDGVLTPFVVFMISLYHVGGHLRYLIYEMITWPLVLVLSVLRPRYCVTWAVRWKSGGWDIVPLTEWHFICRLLYSYTYRFLMFAIVTLTGFLCLLIVIVADFFFTEKSHFQQIICQFSFSQSFPFSISHFYSLSLSLSLLCMLCET